MRLASGPASSAPCATASRVEGVHRVGEKSQAADAIRMRGNQAQLDAGHLPEKAHPDEQSEIPAAQQELEDRQAHVAIPHPGERKLRAVSRRRRVPGGRVERHVLAPDDQDTDAIHEGDQQHLGEHRIAEPKRRRDGGIESRHGAFGNQMAFQEYLHHGTQCAGAPPARQRSAGAAPPGSGRELPGPAGTVRSPSRPAACPSSADSTRSGSQASSEMTMMRWRTSISASSDRCARRRSWKSGPPRTREKSCGSGGAAETSPDCEVQDFTCSLSGRRESVV